MKPRELIPGEIVQIDPDWNDGREERWFGGCLMVVTKQLADGAMGYVFSAGVGGPQYYRCSFAHMESTGGIAPWQVTSAGATELEDGPHG